MTFLSGEFFCFGCRRYRPDVAKAAEVKTTKPHCKTCAELFAKRQSPEGIARRKRAAKAVQLRYLTDKGVTEAIKYLTKGGG
jgi:hypothetical protein